MPEDRVGTRFLHEDASQQSAIQELCWEGVKAKRLTNPAAAAEDEAASRFKMDDLPAGIQDASTNEVANFLTGLSDADRARINAACMSSM